MSDERDLAQARADAASARERLLGAAQAVQARLKPASLASDAWETVRDKGEVVAEGAARAVAKRPAVASAAVLGIVALLARKPIARLFGRLRKDPKD
ncbi:hypothetical protein [Sphingomonas sp. MMS24-J13]|uniref:hypothetical protein n=1 Tax=Sphingomonas sp. MMS24-J13 TaxID=3238686 RepID=UPI00384D3774